MIRSAAIRAAAAHCYALPMRRPSRPHAFAQITQEVRSRVEQFGKQTGVAGLSRLAERKRGVAAHRKAEPAGQCDGRRKASPLCRNLEKATALPRRERDYLPADGARVRRYCTGTRDNPLETGGRPLGSSKRAGRAARLPRPPDPPRVRQRCAPAPRYREAHRRRRRDRETAPLRPPRRPSCGIAATDGDPPPGLALVLVLRFASLQRLPSGVYAAGSRSIPATEAFIRLRPGSGRAA